MTFTPWYQYHTCVNVNVKTICHPSLKEATKQPITYLIPHTKLCVFFFKKKRLWQNEKLDGGGGGV